MHLDDINRKLGTHFQLYKEDKKYKYTNYYNDNLLNESLEFTGARSAT